VRKIQIIFIALLSVTVLCAVTAAAAPDENNTMNVEDYTVALEEESPSDPTYDYVAPRTGVTYKSVIVDSITGEMISGETGTLVALSPSCSYDKVNGLFQFYADDSLGTVYTSNVPNGATVQQSVALNVSDVLQPQLYRSGVLLSDPDWGNITVPGAYSLSIMTDGELYSGVLTFTILKENVGSVFEFTTPEYFRILKAKRNDESIPCTDYSVELTEEGVYSISYDCTALEKTYHLTFTVDHTPPQLLLDGVEEGVARGPVTLSGMEDGDTVEIYRDGELMAFSQTISPSGDYSVVIYDAAGNSTTYHFTIKTYFNRGTWVFMLLITLLSIMGILFVMYKRRKFRSN